jgi:NADH:ubiquinone reductase (H+-translocating)
LYEPSLKAEFRRINLAATRIVLVDMAPRVLGTFASELSEAAKRRLENLGVEVRLGHSVDQIDAEGIVVGGERIASKVVIWTAGVAPSPAGKWLNVETDRAGRVRIQNDLTVHGFPDIYVVGDTASLEQDGKPLPGVAQVAIQQGRYAGRRIAQSLLGKPSQKPFRYFDKGNMAVIGAGFAILEAGRVRLSGIVRLARVGRNSPSVSLNWQPASHRFLAVDLEFFDRSNRGPVNREPHSPFQTG